MRELFSLDFVWRAGFGFRRMSDERVSLESDAVFRRVSQFQRVELERRADFSATATEHEIMNQCE
jgi:hypothetical protein